MFIRCAVDEMGIADLCDHERLDLTGVRDMRANAKVHHRAASVDSGGGAIGNFRLNDVLLVFIVLQ